MPRIRDLITRWSIPVVLACGLIASSSGGGWPYVLLAGAALGGAATWFMATRAFSTRPPLLEILALFIGLTCLQLLPLPGFIVDAVAPRTYDVLAAGSEILGEERAWYTLSLDPPTSLYVLVLFIALFAFAATCLRVARNEVGRRWLILCVVGTGTACALIGVGQRILGIDAIGRDNAGTNALLSFIINPNHQGAAMVLVACCSLGRGAETRGASRLAWLGIFLCSIGLTALTGSRGALLILGIGAATTVSLLLWRRRSRRFSRNWLTGVVFVTCGAVLALGFTADEVISSLRRTDLTREAVVEGGRGDLWQHTAEMVQAHRWTGVGPGAFVAAFGPFHPRGGVPGRAFGHAESLYLQVFADWGILGGLLLAAAALGLFMTAGRAAVRSPLEAGVVGGLSAVLVQSIFDVAPMVPGIALMMVAALACVTWVPVRGASSGRARWERLALLAAGGGVLALTSSSAVMDLGRDRQLAGTFASARAPAALRVAYGQQAMRRHPADYFPVGVATLALIELQRDEALAYANHGLRLNPQSAHLRALTANLAMVRGRRAEACVHFAIALANMKHFQGLLRYIARDFPDDAGLARCVPVDQHRMLAGLDAAARPGAALELARRRAAVFAPDPDVLLELLTRELKAGNIARARRVAAELPTKDSNGAFALLLFEAKAGTLQDLAPALAMGRDQELPAQLRIERLLQLAGVLTDSQPADARQLLHAALGIASGRRAALGRIRSALSTVERALGNTHQAEWEAQQAREMSR